ncbi:MAG: acyl-CoA dehydratase activase-related protein [Candidatus Acidiferrum sp.]
MPQEYAWVGALGCALIEYDSQTRAVATTNGRYHSRGHSGGPESGLPRLSLANVLLLRCDSETLRTEPLPAEGRALPTYLGIDVGSVSTNLALLDESGRLLHGTYLRTSGRPVEVVQQGLQEIGQLFARRILVRGVGTTGSGRELIGELVGADTVKDEITAHKTGALFVHEELVRKRTAPPDERDVDTIFEIGGQDSKFISIEHGVVVDFAMNEACAAGTGSFLEEQAERLGIEIKDEFAALALASAAPIRLGERCTVFMERDITAWMQRGSRVADLAAGLSYSVALNYLNRVVRGRKIGEVIYFQGGTAYNDAVAAAFSHLLGKRIIVPPHNGIIGAIGMALIAKQVMLARECHREQTLFQTAAVETSGASVKSPAPPCPPAAITKFRGFEPNHIPFKSREFVCKACPNFCDMKEITIAGSKTYWGDKCSDKFRKRARTDRQPVIDDLMAFRDLLTRDAAPRPTSGRFNGRLHVGIPQAMYFYDLFPFWLTYLREVGMEVVLSGVTDQHVATRGAELSLAEPCLPVQIAHGHVESLLQGSAERPPVDLVLLPNVMDMEAPRSAVSSYLCPWNQTLPYVVRSVPEFEHFADRMVSPTLYFRAGRIHIQRQLADCFERLGVSRRSSNSATEAAYEAQRRFNDRLLKAGEKACATLRSSDASAILLVGRPYNIYDRNGNCDIPRKLRDLFGVNVVPLDLLPLDDRAVEILHDNMFWYSGRRILGAGQFAREHPSFHIIYMTNFKCGPDSFIKHFLRDVVGVPFLVLQFDGHGNDAGYLTRCEAYLDSKGLLR